MKNILNKAITQTKTGFKNNLSQLTTIGKKLQAKGQIIQDDEAPFLNQEVKHINYQEPDFVGRTGLYTKTDKAKEYAAGPSFVDMLPWIEFLDDEKAMLLEDGRSLGAVFEVTPFGTEGREEEFLADVRDRIKDAIQESFDEFDVNPWVIQFYCQDEPMASSQAELLRQYVKPRAKGTKYTENWLAIMEKHLHDISKEGGLFFDKSVTKTNWKGQYRRTRIIIYRYVDNSKSHFTPLDALNNTSDRLMGSLNSSGIAIKRLTGSEIFDWLKLWFNPNPLLSYNTKDDFYNNFKYYENEFSNDDESNVNLAWQDYSESLFVRNPVSKDDLWFFDQMPHEVIVVDKLKRAPLIGHTTGEIKNQDAYNSMFDSLPEHTIMSMTVVVYPQSSLEAHLAYIAKKSIGDSTDATYTEQECNDVKQYLRQKHKLFRMAIAFYIRAETIPKLKRSAQNLRLQLLQRGFVPTEIGCEIAPLSSYLRWLPMNFNPADDRKEVYTNLNFVQHIANLAPFLGRSKGSGNPGISFFNRGGEPFNFDPLSKLDREKNAHKLMFGPTGAGKSATMIGELSQVMAIYRPWLFIAEAGNSLGLFADYAKRHGLTVNRVQLKPGSGITLPIFKDCYKLIEDKNLKLAITEAELEAQDEKEEQAFINDLEDGDEQRDILGEMEIAARLMITGGEKKEEERLERADRAMIRKAIIMAAEKTYQEKRQTLTQDIRDALFAISKENIPEDRKNKAYAMAESMNLFCSGFDGELFNTEGDIWPEADITIVDFATYAREGYEAQLSIAYISLINHINSMGEKYQHAGRPIINATDEAHIITVHPLLSRYLAKASKMWRKLGIWLWLATQNMSDFPNEASKLLNMVEWWVMLCGIDEDEINKICKFKSLNEPQKNLIRAAKKEDRKYTEGVVISGKKDKDSLFRVVPPSIYLALAMTEPEEKARRLEIIKEHANKITELDAALIMAKEIDKNRGIQHG